MRVFIHYSFPFCLQQPELGQDKVRSLELQQSLPQQWQGPKNLHHKSVPSQVAGMKVEKSGLQSGTLVWDTSIPSSELNYGTSSHQPSLGHQFFMYIGSQLLNSNLQFCHHITFFTLCDSVQISFFFFQTYQSRTHPEDLSSTFFKIYAKTLFPNKTVSTKTWIQGIQHLVRSGRVFREL